VLYLVAFFLSPLALLIAGKPVQALLNGVIYLLAWIGLMFFIIPGVIAWLIGVVHAMAIISGKNADKRTERIVNAVEARNATRD
jgi:UPF0716 family protein affecting phage T7 exclusion